MALFKLAPITLVAALIAYPTAGARPFQPSRSPAIGVASTILGTPENGLIAFNEVNFDRQSVEIFTVKPDGSGVRRLTHPPRGFTTALGDWSPDSRWIAYHKQPWGGDLSSTHIVVMRTNGTHVTDLTRGSCRPDVCGEDAPAWSPNGHRIAYHGYDALDENVPSIFVMRADGSHRHRVTEPHGSFADWTPSWSSDGSRLIFERWWGNRDVSALFTVRPDGTHLRRVTRWGIDAGEFPDWSPDGRWILFQNHTNGSGNPQLCLIHPNGTGFLKITHGSDAAWSTGAFSPDGTMVTAIRSPGEASENDVYVMSLDGSHMVPVTTSLPNDRAEGVPDWGPAR
jgi:Tol biopolymer transport system component